VNQSSITGDLQTFTQVFNVSRETMDRLKIYADLLAKWQRRFNLVGPSTIEVLWWRHFADSLELREHVPSGAKNWLDIGTGAGFPGLVIGACGEHQGIHIDLVESNAKKCAFLREVSRQIKAPVSVHNCRIEAIDSQAIQAMSLDVVTARALAPLSLLLELAEKPLEYGAVGLFPRGQNIEDELTACSKYWKMETRIVERNYGLPGKILVVDQCARR
jgi:16S rRNA (guanine527-N7)-methyltransferase